MGWILADTQAGLSGPFRLLAIGVVLILWGMFSIWSGTVEFSLFLGDRCNSGSSCDQKDHPLPFAYLIYCIFFFGAVVTIGAIVAMLLG